MVKPFCVRNRCQYSSSAHLEYRETRIIFIGNSLYFDMPKSVLSWMLNARRFRK
jgi:hypothetical protein